MDYYIMIIEILRLLAVVNNNAHGVDSGRLPARNSMFSVRRFDPRPSDMRQRTREWQKVDTSAIHPQPVRQLLALEQVHERRKG